MAGPVPGRENQCFPMSSCASVRVSSVHSGLQDFCHRPESLVLTMTHSPRSWTPLFLFVYFYTVAHLCAKRENVVSKLQDLTPEAWPEASVRLALRSELHSGEGAGLFSRRIPWQSVQENRQERAAQGCASFGILLPSRDEMKRLPACSRPDGSLGPRAGCAAVLSQPSGRLCTCSARSPDHPAQQPATPLVCRGGPCLCHSGSRLARWKPQSKRKHRQKQWEGKKRARENSQGARSRNPARTETKRGRSISGSGLP